MNQIACFFDSKLYYKEKRIGYSKGINIISTLYRAIIANILDKDEGRFPFGSPSP